MQEASVFQAMRVSQASVLKEFAQNCVKFTQFFELLRATLQIIQILVQVHWQKLCPKLGLLRRFCLRPPADLK